MSSVVGGVVGEGASLHRQRAAISVADATATVIARTAGDSDVRQVNSTSLVVDTTAGAAPAASQRTIAEVERSVIAHGDNLSASVPFT